LYYKVLHTRCGIYHDNGYAKTAMSSVYKIQKSRERDATGRLPRLELLVEEMKHMSRISGS